MPPPERVHLSEEALIRGSAIVQQQFSTTEVGLTTRSKSLPQQIAAASMQAMNYKRCLLLNIRTNVSA